MASSSTTVNASELQAYQTLKQQYDALVQARDKQAKEAQDQEQAKQAARKANEEETKQRAYHSALMTHATNNVKDTVHHTEDRLIHHHDCTRTCVVILFFVTILFASIAGFLYSYSTVEILKENMSTIHTNSTQLTFKTHTHLNQTIHATHGETLKQLQLTHNLLVGFANAHQTHTIGIMVAITINAIGFMFFINEKIRVH